jgi:leader peptidase (prepilin peptidase)/N-methyltransferase
MTQYAVLYWSLVLFVGAMAGNFMTVAEYRIPIKKTILSGRSFCPECKTSLGLFEILPLISWVCLLGKCLHCGLRVPVRYVLIEISAALLAILAFALTKNTVLASFLFGGFLLVLLQALFILKQKKTIYNTQVMSFIWCVIAITFCLIKIAEPLRSL